MKKMNKDFRHITLIEEAHRLLSRYMPGDNRNRKQGVEVFSDMIAEVRKYGEAFIIADQIPDKMTPEVLKNTSTKIVHKLFAKDDKDAIGNTMSLTDEQKNYLSNLQPGRAIVFSQGWDKAIQVKIDMKTSTDSNDIEEAEIHRRSLNYYSLPNIARRGVIPGLNKIPADKLNPDITNKFLWIHRQSYNWSNELKARLIDSLAENQPPEDLLDRQVEITEGILEAVNQVGEEFLLQYIELIFQEIIFDQLEFKRETLQLIREIKNSSTSEKSVEKLKLYISKIIMQDLCKLQNGRKN